MMITESKWNVKRETLLNHKDAKVLIVIEPQRRTDAETQSLLVIED